MDFTEIHQKVSSSDCGKFWLDLNPMTKLIMVVWRCDIYSPAWVRLWLRMGDSPADLCLYLRQGQADGSRHGIYFCGIRHCFGDGTGIFL